MRLLAVVYGEDRAALVFAREAFFLPPLRRAEFRYRVVLSTWPFLTAQSQSTHSVAFLPVPDGEDSPSSPSPSDRTGRRSKAYTI